MVGGWAVCPWLVLYVGQPRTLDGNAGTWRKPNTPKNAVNRRYPSDRFASVEIECRWVSKEPPMIDDTGRMPAVDIEAFHVHAPEGFRRYIASSEVECTKHNLV